MNNEKLIEIVNWIEDKEMTIKDSWYFHGTKYDISTIEKILTEGLLCSYLRGESSRGGYNGKYYVSVSKMSDAKTSAYKNFQYNPMFVLDNIKPLPANSKFFLAGDFMNTFIPIRTSYYDGEYHTFLRIEPSKIIALQYSLYSILKMDNNLEIKEFLFLQKIILCLEKLKLNLPIYDFSTCKEINKERVLSLKLD